MGRWFAGWSATALAFGSLLVAGPIGPASASTPPPPMTGDVACSLDGTSTFKPYLGYQPGIGDRRAPEGQDSKWKVLGALTGCTGTQAGGHPNRPGPITTGELLVKATAVDHTCQKVTDHGLTISRVRVRWHDALGRNLGRSIGTGTVTVDGLRNGSQYLSFFPPVLDPTFVPPGIITFQATGALDPTSRVFPGQSFSFTAVADETILDFVFPCSQATPPLAMGVRSLSFHGGNGASSMTIP